MTLPALPGSDRAKKVLGPMPHVQFGSIEKSIDYPGDQPKLLDVSNPYQLFPPEPISLHRVVHGSSDEITGDGAPVLLLGDSYTTLFRSDDPDSGAGLPDQLMDRLGCGVQTIASPGVTPAKLLEDLRERPQALPQKQLVIWTLADRTVVTVKSWKQVKLPVR